jgi:hypothetical protein
MTPRPRCSRRRPQSGGERTGEIVRRDAPVRTFHRKMDAISEIRLSNGAAEE